MRRFLLLFMLVLARGALAQGTVPELPEAPPPPVVPELSEAPPPLVRAPDEPQPAGGGSLQLTRGQLLRVQPRKGPSQPGELVSLTPGALSLQISPEQVVEFALADVEQLEVRKRAVKAGALVGAGVVGLGGGLFFTGLCSFGGSVLPCAVLGTLLSVVSGATVGALMGMAVPSWSTVYTRRGQQRPSIHLQEPDEDVLAHWFSGDLPVGELGLQLGYAQDMRAAQPTAGFGGRLHVLVLLGPYIALGPELAFYQGSGSRSIAFSGGVFRERNNLVQAGGLLRIGVDAGPVRVAVLGGLASSSSGSDHLEVSVGGAVEARLSQHLPPLALEARYHINAEGDEGIPGPDSLTLGLATRLRW